MFHSFIITSDSPSLIQPFHHLHHPSLVSGCLCVPHSLPCCLLTVLALLFFFFFPLFLVFPFYSLPCPVLRGKNFSSVSFYLSWVQSWVFEACYTINNSAFFITLHPFVEHLHLLEKFSTSSLFSFLREDFFEVTRVCLSSISLLIPPHSLLVHLSMHLTLLGEKVVLFWDYAQLPLSYTDKYFGQCWFLFLGEGSREVNNKSIWPQQTRPDTQQKPTGWGCTWGRGGQVM